MKHNYTKGSMIGLSVAFMILPLTFMSLRVWAKVMGKRFALDDYLAVGALVSLTTHIAACPYRLVAVSLVGMLHTAAGK